LHPFDRATKITNRRELIAFYRDEACDNGVSFYVCDDREFVRDPTCFFDHSHLSRKGALVFTEKLARFVRQDAPCTAREQAGRSKGCKDNES
jgi:hypothetical protein